MVDPSEVKQSILAAFEDRNWEDVRKLATQRLAAFGTRRLGAGDSETFEWLSRIATSAEPDHVLAYYVSGFFDVGFAEFILPFALTFDSDEAWKIGRGVGWTGLTYERKYVLPEVIYGLTQWNRKQMLAVCDYVRLCASCGEMDARASWDYFYAHLEEVLLDHASNQEGPSPAGNSLGDFKEN